ncbi:MAG TPA: serine/threonine-protein kinase [Vicinamibacterales bacterium]
MPDAIAHYKILSPLGAGGLGEVYRARDTNLGRTVAVKVLPEIMPEHEAFLEALLDTSRRLMTLSHPNIAMLFDIGQEGNRPYLVFEFVQGQPLGAVINGRALHVRRALEFGINLADALADAHSADMIHGDIRPDTVMITPKDRAKFVNFGLSRFTVGGARRFESAGAYVAPEEIAGHPADSRSDIYSLGAVMFEMLTGRQRSRGQVLTGLNATVPPELEHTIGRMLASNIEHRLQSAATVAAEFRSVAAILDVRTEAAEAAEAAEPLRHRRRVQRRAGIVAIAVGVLVVATAIAAWWMQ